MKRKKWLIEPQPIVKLNSSLVYQVETKRFACPDYSDAHWLVQLITEYHCIFPKTVFGRGCKMVPGPKEVGPPQNMVAAAIEDVFQTFVDGGAKKAIARAQALKDNGFPIITWFPADHIKPDDWNRIRKECLVDKDGGYHYRQEGD